MQHDEVLLAAGCFWGVQEIFRKISGVLETEVGYTGGTLENPTYEDIVRGTTGHAEAIRIVFDPSRIALEEILDYFLRLHDPTTLNRQGNDAGSQYRSAIFYGSEAQRDAAGRAIQAAMASGRWKRPIVTEVTEAGPFYSAERYHQDYLQKNPGGYSCHFVRD